MGVLYVCDEPSIGLHPVDDDRLIQHARAPARPRQHRADRRARRSDDARRRPHHRHGPGRGRARRPRRRRGHDRRRSWRSEARSPARTSAGGDRCPCRTTRRPGNGKSIRHRGRAREQPEEHRRRDPARAVRLRHRRLRLRQEHADQRHAVQEGWRSTSTARATAPGSVDGDRGPRAHRQGHRHRPVADRPHAALEPGDVHRHCSRPSATCSPRCRKRGCAATRRAASPST